MERGVEPALARLAAAHGVATTYTDSRSRPVQVAREVVVAVLDRLGVDASTPAAIRQAAAAVRAEPATTPVVLTQGAAGAADASAGGGVVRLEDGGERPVTAGLPTDLPLGYHEWVDGDRTTPVIVTPG